MKLASYKRKKKNSRGHFDLFDKRISDGGRQIPKLWPQRILTTIFSQTQTPETYSLHICPQNLYQMMTEREKAMGISWMTIKMKKGTKMN